MNTPLLRGFRRHLIVLMTAFLLVGVGCSDRSARNQEQRQEAVRPEPIRVPHDFDRQRAITKAPAFNQSNSEDAKQVADVAQGSNVQVESAAFVVEVEEAELNGGIVRIAVFDNADSFKDRQNPVRSSEQVAANGRCKWQIDGLPPGEYAVAAYQDKNGNGELDTGSFGIPKERYGFSRHAKDKVLPPSYSQARVNHQGETTSVKIILR